MHQRNELRMTMWCLGLVYLVAWLAVLPGCGRGGGGPKKTTIGVALPSLTHPFFIHLKQGVLAEAKKLDVDVIVADAEDIAAKQMAIVEDFIAKRVDGVLLAPIGADALVPAVEALNAAAIPVATVDRKVSAGEVLIHVGADNVEGGRTAAQYIIERLGGNGAVIELEGTPGASPAIDRKKGFEETIGGSKIKILSSQTADFQRAKGQSVMENLLQVQHDFQAVYAANDEMILGAIEALEAHGVDRAKVVTVGYDAIPEALECIRQQRLTASVEQFPARQASTALRQLVEYIRHGSAPETKEVYLKPVVIDARNLNEAEVKQ